MHIRKPSPKRIPKNRPVEMPVLQLPAPEPVQVPKTKNAPEEKPLRGVVVIDFYI